MRMFPKYAGEMYEHHTNNADGILGEIEVEGAFSRQPSLFVELDRKTHQSCAAACLGNPCHGWDLGAAKVGAAKTGQVALVFAYRHFQLIGSCGRISLSQHTTFAEVGHKTEIYFSSLPPAYRHQTERRSPGT
jgi:hypothetical protein